MNEPQRHRDTEDERSRSLTSRIIGAAIEVHRVLGPGLLEPMYESALCVELDQRGLHYVRQFRVPAFYKGRRLGDYRIDLIVEDQVVVEVKCVTNVLPLFDAQLLTYMRLTKKRVGLLINFHTPLLKDGVTRKVL